ncbi:LysR family transcriptional regulator [Desulfohalobiaceae bacterium Ax17]|uniref:winged helix-turn-helix domain-containing protein n=1 Tax=Desulfovulcanus ferrireducens TaxID=2831190 RepID=UPI00207BBC20|nr:LysR family transcriptional regulator [Desulfovulcanus ferrireducens]MBT8762859.1 LysR family transcriptional regulator [Desulfovulcanus ferrireducens]
MDKIKAVLRIQPWFESDKGVLFGMGRVLLLQKVIELGSLNKAAKEMGMSYRAAWGKIKASEDALGAPLLIREEGKRSFKLSPLGEELVNKFIAWQKRVEEFALKTSQDEFPWDVELFEKKEIGQED